MCCCESNANQFGFRIGFGDLLLGRSHWLPLFHDAMLIILDEMSEERLMERIRAQAALPPDAPRGERFACAS